MKRGLSLIVLALLLIPVIALAQDQIPTGSSNITSTERITPFLEKDVEIPEGLELFARVFLGVKPEQPITWPELSILIACFLIFFFVFKDVMDMIPFFETKARAIVGAFIVVSLVGISGGFMLLMSFLIDLGSLFGFLTAHPLLTLFFVFIILLVIMFLSMTVLKVIKRKISLEIAEAEGEEEGMMKRSLRTLKKIWGLEA